MTDNPEQPNEESTSPEPTGDQAEATSAPAPERSRRRGGAWLAGLALLLGLAAITASALLWWQYRAFYVDLDAADDQAIQSMAAVRSKLDELGDELQELSRNQRRLRSDLARQREDLLSFPQRMQRLETNVAEVAGGSDRAKDIWLAAQAEYFLELANAELGLAHNPDSAALALGLADTRLRDLGDPALTGVRERIARELEQLEAVERPDLEGIAARLAGLRSLVKQLPLQPIAMEGEAVFESADEQPSEPGLKRAMASVGDALRSVISVRRTDQSIAPQLPPKEQFFLYRNLEIQLETARLALLLGAEKQYIESLSNARDWLNSYFDRQDSAVNSAASSIDELLAIDTQPAYPDISGSLRALRQGVEPAAP